MPTKRQFNTSTKFSKGLSNRHPRNQYYECFPGMLSIRKLHRFAYHVSIRYEPKNNIAEENNKVFNYEKFHI